MAHQEVIGWWACLFKELTVLAKFPATLDCWRNSKRDRREFQMGLLAGDSRMKMISFCTPGKA